MKVAIQLSGIPQNFKTVFNFQQQQLYNQLDQYDLYYVTWNTIDLDILKKINPKKCLLLDSDKFWKLNRVKNDILYCKEKSYKSHYYIKYKSTYIQFFQRYICNRLRINSGIKYDVVMIVRPDIIFLQPFKKEWLGQMTKTLNIPAGADCGNGYSDLFAVGNPNLITTYCKAYLNIKSLLEEPLCRFYHPEHLLKIHLNKNNIYPDRFSFPLNLREHRYNF